ncbi:RNA polymerase sigma factor (sigma-70 family) [Phycicoccus badiiscoriae]|uniref:RNA polymerase sigma factor (Sigma-70 family) n=1 Tax=Pedococcus badiiscoriae TaxID=642776 RepID=A0A852WI64_9MICO|nr:sigma-70 family RNA polymerase sigma factor [Pedococcus badiiscoriae]NYG07271.1 RNA polymerase sigma factor (sigma-70 family) [Pedococcus badiiscoriae]
MTEVDDLELTSPARDGDERAAVELWTRHYPAALSTAHRVARQPRDAEELASDAFSGMLAALRRGGGPTGSVRAYLLTSVRNGVTTRGRRANAFDILTDQISLLENAADVPADPVAAASELSLMREAFASLPARWQHVLWRTAVDHEANISVADELGVSPNAVAALARRARQVLRAAYVQAHVSRGAIDPECAPFIRGLAAMLTLPADTAPTARHVRGCARCTDRLAELRKVDQNLSGILGPAVLVLLPTGVGTAIGAGPAGGAGSAAHATAAHGDVAASGSAHRVALATAVAVGSGLLTWALWPERPALERTPVAVATSLSPSAPTSSPAPPPPTPLPTPAATPTTPPTSSPPAPSTTKQPRRGGTTHRDGTEHRADPDTDPGTHDSGPPGRALARRGKGRTHQITLHPGNCVRATADRGARTARLSARGSVPGRVLGSLAGLRAKREGDHLHGGGFPHRDRAVLVGNDLDPVGRPLDWFGERQGHRHLPVWLRSVCDSHDPLAVPVTHPRSDKRPVLRLGRPFLPS